MKHLHTVPIVCLSPPGLSQHGHALRLRSYLKDNSTISEADYYNCYYYYHYYYYYCYCYYYSYCYYYYYYFNDYYFY